MTLKWFPETAGVRLGDSLEVDSDGNISSKVAGWAHMKPVAATYTAGNYAAATMTTLAATANTVQLYPAIWAESFTIDAIAYACTTASTTGVCKAAVYASNNDGRPTGTPLITGAEQTNTATGTKQDATVSLAIKAGRQYWLAIHTGTANVTVRAIAVGGLSALGTTPAATTSYTGITYNQTYSSGLPDLTSVSWASANLSTAARPAIYLRVA